MYSLGFLLLCAGSLAKTLPYGEKPFYKLEDAKTLFEDFIQDFGKKYVDEAEKNMRFEVFKTVIKQINEFNADPEHLSHYGINQFADMSKEEYKEKYSCVKPQNYTAPSINVIEPTIDLPDSFDWRARGKVTEVKNQGGCGACWAFSAIGTVESAYAIKHNQLLELSEQQLIDCDTQQQDNGCVSGFLSQGLSYLAQVGGSMSESAYPYTARKGQCRFSPSQAQVKVTGSIPVQQSEDALAQALVTNGPISIALDGSSFHTYHGGIQDCPGKDVNHAVLLVGYGSENGELFWIVKNSYGPSWGEEGYIRLRRGVNNCGLLQQQPLIGQVQ